MERPMFRSNRSQDAPPKIPRWLRGGRGCSDQTRGFQRALYASHADLASPVEVNTNFRAVLIFGDVQHAESS